MTHNPSPNSKKDPKEESLSPVVLDLDNTLNTDNIASFDVAVHTAATYFRNAIQADRDRLYKTKTPEIEGIKIAHNKFRKEIISAFQELVERVQRDMINDRTLRTTINPYLQGYYEGMQDFVDALRKEISGE